MKQLTIIVGIIVVLTLTACNRFDNTFEPEPIDTSFKEWLSDFSEMLTNALKDNDLIQIMELYQDDYLYDGRTKDDVEAYFQSIADDNPDSIYVDVGNYDAENLSFRYRIAAYQDTVSIRNRTVLIDTTITEIAVRKDAGYMITGNGQDEIVVQNRRVLVELFTARLCPNCPYVEAALYSLKQEYGERFIYIEYHMQAPFNFGHQDIAGYYGVTSLPVGIIQGQTEIRGGSETDSYSRYENAITRYFDIEADLVFSDFDYSVDSDIISFSLQLTAPEGDIPPDLKFKYALIEKESSANNQAGQPFRNVVITKGEQDLTADMFTIDDNTTATVEIEFNKPDFEFNSSPSIVVWLQTIERFYDNETCIVHNTAEYQVNINN